MKIHPIHNFINRESELFKILKFLPPLSESGPWVAGGSVWKSIERLPLECDVDVFFKNESQYNEWLRNMKSIPYDYHVISSTSNKYNISFNFHIYENGYNKTVKVQGVNFKFHDDVEQLISGFDFTACQFAFDGTNLYSGDTSFDDLRERKIIFNNVHDLVASGVHLRKYLNIGFTIPESQNEMANNILKAVKNKCVKHSNPCREININGTITPLVVIPTIESNISEQLMSMPLTSQTEAYPTPITESFVTPTPAVTTDVFGIDFGLSENYHLVETIREEIDRDILNSLMDSNSISTRYWSGQTSSIGQGLDMPF